MIPRILRRRVSAECAASLRPAPHHMPDTGSTRPGPADAPTTPRGRPRGADPGPSPITDSSEPAPRNPMMTGPKIPQIPGRPKNPSKTQCTYRCVVLPDAFGLVNSARIDMSLNAPTGAWCSLTLVIRAEKWAVLSQCTYRCVVLPDPPTRGAASRASTSLNAPTGAGCSLTVGMVGPEEGAWVSMHLQVRGAP